EEAFDDEDEDFDDGMSDELDAVSDDEADEEIEPDELPRLQVALRQARQSSDLQRQVDLLKKIGEAQVKARMDNEAISTYGELLTGYETLEDAEGTLETLDILSTLMARTENSSAAVMYAVRGIGLADELGEIDTKMHLLATLG